jgi:hypothetical protein
MDSVCSTNMRVKVNFDISVRISQCKKKLYSRILEDNIKTDHMYIYIYMRSGFNSLTIGYNDDIF